MKIELKIKRIPRRKPSFTRQQTSIKRLGSTDRWRYPRGKSSKVRLSHNGHKLIPSIGYGSPGYERHLNKYGLKEVLVTNISDIHNLNPHHHAIVLSGRLGLHKKLILLEKIKEHDIHVMNIKDIDKYIADARNELKKRKEDKKSLLKKKEDSKKEGKPKEKKEEKKEESISQEEKEKQLREEQRKVLEKKQIS